MEIIPIATTYEDEIFDISRGYQGYGDDEELIGEVLADEYTIGYVGYTQYVLESDDLFAVAIADDTFKGVPSSDAEAVLPTTASLQDGSYPIARVLYMNVENSVFGSNEAIFEYLVYGFAAGQPLIEDTIGYVLLSEALLNATYDRILQRGNSEITHFNDRDCGDLSGAIDSRFTTQTAQCTALNEIMIAGSSTVYPVAKVCDFEQVR